MGTSELSTSLFTVCDYALTSGQGKLSVMGMFDRIFATSLPTRYPRFFIVAVLHGAPGSKHQVELKLETPSGKNVLPPRPVEVSVGPNGKANIITDVANVTLPESGEYKIVVASSDQIVSEIFVTVARTGTEEPTHKIKE